MHRIYEDTFKPGDLVTWRDENYATLTSGRRRYGDRLTIKAVRPIIDRRNARGAGHNQLVTIQEDPNSAFARNNYFSGAFFRHLAPWEK
jgi:hypothetical protein